MPKPERSSKFKIRKLTRRVRASNFGFSTLNLLRHSSFVIRILAAGLLLQKPFSAICVSSESHSGYVKLDGVTLKDVRWTGGFWAERTEICRSNMIPALWRIMEGTNYSQFYQNFRIAAGVAEGRHRGAPFNDGDFYKWIEAASATLATSHDSALEQKLDEIIAVIAQAQRQDGYIHTSVLIAAKAGAPKKPFEDPSQFETYNMGHLLSAACIHFGATGKTNLLYLARNAADFLCQTLNQPTSDLARCLICPSHYMGMVEMYRT